MKVLLDGGADPFAADDDGDRPLEWAVLSRAREVRDILKAAELAAAARAAPGPARPPRPPPGFMWLLCRAAGRMARSPQGAAWAAFAALVSAAAATLVLIGDKL